MSKHTYKEAAKTLGVPADELLRRVLNVTPIGDDPRFARYIENRPDQVRALWDELDRGLRARNPGLHYVFRDTFVGYRRGGKSATGPASERSQIFASVLVRRERLAVTLPVDPTNFLGHPQVRDLTGVGHHGIGDTQFNIRDEADITAFFELFEEWLLPD